MNLEVIEGTNHRMYLSFTHIADDEKVIKTVGELIDFLNHTLSVGTMTSYKGGDYEIKEHTDVVIGDNGLYGREIDRLAVTNGTLYLVIGSYDYIEMWYDSHNKEEVSLIKSKNNP